MRFIMHYASTSKALIYCVYTRGRADKAMNNNVKNVKIWSNNNSVQMLQCISHFNPQRETYWQLITHLNTWRITYFLFQNMYCLCSLSQTSIILEDIHVASVGIVHQSSTYALHPNKQAGKVLRRLYKCWAILQRNLGNWHWAPSSKWRHIWLFSVILCMLPMEKLPSPCLTPSGCLQHCSNQMPRKYHHIIYSCTGIIGTWD